MVLALGSASACLYGLQSWVDTGPGQAGLITRPLGPAFPYLSLSLSLGLGTCPPRPFAPQCPAQSQEAKTCLRRR